MYFLTLKLRYGNRLILLSSISEAAVNICGYFSGLFLFSVTESIVILCFLSRSKLVGYTRLLTFSINRISLSFSGRRGAASVIICALRW